MVFSTRAFYHMWRMAWLIGPVLDRCILLGTAESRAGCCRGQAGRRRRADIRGQSAAGVGQDGGFGWASVAVAVGLSELDELVDGAWAVGWLQPCQDEEWYEPAEATTQGHPGRTHQVRRVQVRPSQVHVWLIGNPAWSPAPLPNRTTWPCAAS